MLTDNWIPKVFKSLVINYSVRAMDSDAFAKKPFVNKVLR
jgi:hypothetical protein